MAGNKRSERLAQAQTAQAPEKRRPARASSTGGKQYRAAFCPVCGMSHGTKRQAHPGKGYYHPAPTDNFWEWLIARDQERGLGADEPFGIIQEIGQGRGRSFRVIGYFKPEEDQDGYFPLVKRRLLDALQCWLSKGWLSPEEVSLAMPSEAIRSAKPRPRRSAPR